MKKIAILGCGAIGHTHAGAFNACGGAHIEYAIDVVPEKAKAFAEKYNIPHAGTDYREALKDPSIDGVCVCLPNFLHAQVTIDALQAGKHVLCEKPIAMNLEEALAMQAAAVENKVQCVIGVVNRFNDHVNAVKELIAQGELGKVYHVDLIFQGYRSIPGMGRWFTNKKQSGGGVMIDWGIHFVDLALYCLGAPKLVSISGVAHSELAKDMKSYAYTSMWAGPPAYDGVYDVEEMVSGLLRTEGPSIAFQGAWARNINVSNMYVEFLGDKGGIRLKYGGEYVLYTSKDGALFETKRSQKETVPYQNEMAAFIECMSSGKTSRADIQQVLATQAVLDAFYESAALGREVPIKTKGAR